MPSGLTEALQRLRVSDDAAGSTVQDMHPSDLFRSLGRQLEAIYPRGAAGEQAFSAYGISGWSLEDYAAPGFARKYVSKKFEDRCSAILFFLRALDRTHALGTAGAEIVDMGSGPGSGIVAAAKFLAMKGAVPESATLMDPVGAWRNAVEALREVGIRANFRQVEDLNAMVHAMTLHQSSDRLKLIIVSHVLRDFGGDDAAVSAWWRSMAVALRGRRALVLIVERSPCEGLLPKSLPDGGHIHVFPHAELDRTDNASFGAALFLPKGSCVIRVSPETASREAQQSSSLPGRAAPSQPSSLPSGTPRCPDCGGPMVLRVNRRGFNPGSTFYGCAQFPNCRGTR